MSDGDPRSPGADDPVPDDVIPHRHLPPLQYRDLPEPIAWTKMVGPSIILAGMALGSGEFVLWPHIIYTSGFVFFWACLLGVVTQFFMNMEIERWTLATGESAITGFCRLSRWWAPVMLLMTVIPFSWPGWATGAGEILSWLLFGPKEVVDAATGDVAYQAHYSSQFGIGSLLLTGLVLTAGPVVYQTVEKLQFFLVGTILVLIVAIAALVVRGDAVLAMVKGVGSIGELPDFDQTGLTFMGLLGALAFAGVGGALNLGQSNYIKDKGYGMGRYIGRITSPITGQEEPISDVGFHFRHTPENMARWRGWWRAANIEHFFSFLLTCIVCLCLLALVSYSLFYTPEGVLREGVERFGKGMTFIWGEAHLLEQHGGPWLRLAFLVMGVAILLTTELGVLDAVARISTDVVKTNLLRNSEFWSLSKLYYCFLWGQILFGTGILLTPWNEPLFLLKMSAAMNGGVMFLYSLILLYMNSKILSRSLSISPLRFVAMVWACGFFGYFTMQALKLEVLPFLAEWMNGG